MAALPGKLPWCLGCDSPRPAAVSALPEGDADTGYAALRAREDHARGFQIFVLYSLLIATMQRVRSARTYSEVVFKEA